MTLYLSTYDEIRCSEPHGHVKIGREDDERITIAGNAESFELLAARLLEAARIKRQHDDA